MYSRKEYPVFVAGLAQDKHNFGDFTAYNRAIEHLECAFGVTRGALLGHIVSKEGIEVDLDNVKAILQAPAPTNAKALSRFLGRSSGITEYSGI